MDKPGRNDPCPCGSGKKYKKCCFMDDEKNSEILRAVDKAKNEAEIKEILHKPPQVYSVRVSLVSKTGVDLKDNKSIYRIIEINETQSLYDLHTAIQSAFDWDNDHLYSFYMSGKEWDKNSEYSGDPLGGHPDNSTGKAAYETQIRDVIDRIGQKFIYIFDYGDEIIHELEVMEIRDFVKNGAKYPKITAVVGKAPEQYER